MIQHSSLFSNKVEQDDEDTEEDDSNVPNKEENQSESLWKVWKYSILEIFPIEILKLDKKRLLILSQMD